MVTADIAGGMLKDRTVAIDCKCYGKKINITHADNFVGLIEDVQTDFGILITNKGWSKKAKERLPSRLSVRLVEDEPAMAMAMAMIDHLPEPMFQVKRGEEHYTGEFWDNEPFGGSGAQITFHYVERESRRPIDHPDELEWLDQPLASDGLEKLNWSDDESREGAARVVLGHYLGRRPAEEELEAFIVDVASKWGDGQEWSIDLAEMERETGLGPDIRTD